MFYSKLLMASIFFLLSCSSTHLIKQTQSDYSILNKKMNGEEGTIIVKNNRMFIGRNMVILGDSLHFIELYSNTEMIMHTSTIKEIQSINNFRGVVEGCGFGVLIGGGIFGLLYLSQSDPEQESKTLSDDRIGKAFLGMSILVGGTAGLVTGAIRGHKDTYKFESPADTTGLTQINLE